MKEIPRITIGLTISCLIAAFLMGSVFTITEKAKNRNERRNFKETMLQLLGYTDETPPPPELKLNTVYRYIVEKDKKTYMGYMLPVERGGNDNYELMLISLKGEFVDRFDLDISSEEVTDAQERKNALAEALGEPAFFSYGDSAIVAELQDERIAYLLPGEFPGFKTFIEVMLALDPSLEVIGLEIMEHEEDPGLGGEIEKDYFKNQFKGKSFEKLKELEVKKEPLPERYKKFLEAEKKTELFSIEQIKEIRKKYKDDDIFALTGATISSRAVTNGVKNIAEKFAYRMKMLDRIADRQGVPLAF